MIKKISFFVGIMLISLSIFAQGIISINPSIGNAGETVNVTITLDDAVNPPLPPADLQPSEIAIGSISASSFTRTDNTTITASFDIPEATVSGNFDVTVTFSPPVKEDLVYTLSSGFEIIGQEPTIFYVDGELGDDANDGLSWANAKQTIQAAINQADAIGAGDVWVKVGTYYPTSSADREVSFVVKQNVSIYGGFVGTETLLSERDFETNSTILSGNIGSPDNNLDNSYHVVVTEKNARVDGFDITAGCANGDRLNRMGGGIYLADNMAYVENNDFYNNYAEEGGAMYIFNINGATAATSDIVSIYNCDFYQNSANNGGAIVMRVGASTYIDWCDFSENTAQWRGGAIFIDYGAYQTAPITINECDFTSNSSLGNGGAIYSDDMASQLQGTYWYIYDCIFTNNSATYRGGAISNYNSNNFPTISGNQFTGNTAGQGGAAVANDYGVSINILDNTLEPGQDVSVDDTSNCTGNNCP